MFKIFGWACVVIGAIASLLIFFSISSISTGTAEEVLIMFIASPIPFFVMAFQGCFFFAIGYALEYLKRSAEANEALLHKYNEIEKVS